MHEKALPKGSKELLARLKSSSSPALRGWILAGGTALALHIGHRISEDFDFFRTDPVDIDRLHDAFSEIGPYETLQEEKHTLTLLTDGIKISFFRISDPFMFVTIPYSFFHIADIRDITLMKLVAICNRGSRKDFVDLFSILRSGMILKDYLDLLPEKYSKGRTNIYQILKSLTFFDDAEAEPLPNMLEPFNWEECKAFFIREAHSLVLPPG